MLKEPTTLTTPLGGEQLELLRAGEKVLLSGFIYTARDAAHKKIFTGLQQGQPPPFELRGQVIYYCGPTPAPRGAVIGSAGPTTSSRMDIYTPCLLELGLKGMIGKGKRSAEVRKTCLEQKAVYFAAIGGAGALIAQHIKSNELIAFPELGTEAVRRLYIENLPLIVINDCLGNDFYEQSLGG